MAGPRPESAQAADPFAVDIARHVWRTRYRHRDGAAFHDDTIQDTWRRIARALAAVEPAGQVDWADRFYSILLDFHFLPGGRIQAGAGTGRQVTLFNCFVMGRIDDSMAGIFQALHEGATTMQQGGGVGYDFSTLRPRGAQARGVGAIASGPVSFMGVWDAMCQTILSTGARRGAMMGTLRCDHPDIEEFVTAKQSPGALHNFNLSVQVTDAFIAAVRADADWPLVFPAAAGEPASGTITREWPGHDGPVACRVYGRPKARALWDRLLRATYEWAEPGVLFIDQVNRLNNLWYSERITATNPCGEIPLPPYGACDLGSINLTQFVRRPFTPEAALDEPALAATTRLATRLLDNVIDASQFPLPAQAAQAQRARRIGLGLTGLADALMMLGLAYESPQAREVAAGMMRTVCHEAYRASIALAREKGACPAFDRDRYLEGRFIRTLPADVRDGIARHGIRNSHVTAIAPTGTISLLANNVSSGLEPVFADAYRRAVLDEDGISREFELVDSAVRLWRQQADRAEGTPPAFRAAGDLDAGAHLAMQAALQPFVDNSISKTITVAADYPFEQFRRIYDAAYDLGLKGCTTFRPDSARGAVVTAMNPGANAPHCCAIEREAD